MRVAWLAPYPVEMLAPSLKLTRQKRSHPCSWIVALSESLVQRTDIELHLVTESQLVSESQTVTRNNITFHVLREAVPFTNRGWPPWLPWSALTGCDRLSRRFVGKLRQIAPDVVHAHGVEHVYGSAGMRSGLPCLISIQGILGEYQKVIPTFGGRFLSHWERQTVQRGRYFTCRTAFDSGFVRSVNPQARIFMIHEAMNPVFFQNYWEPWDEDSMLYVGSLEPRKGLDTLLEALALLRAQRPSVRLRVVGGGVQEPWRAMCRRLGIEEAVEFIGFQPAEAIARCHREAQLFVLPSRIENSPNTLAEAMVSGMPVVATAVGGVPSMLEDGVTGMLVPCDDATALARNIVTLLKQPEKRTRFGNNARRIARERHAPTNVATATQKAYQEIVKARPN